MILLLLTPFPPDCYRDFPQGGRSYHFPLGGNKKGGKKTEKIRRGIFRNALIFPDDYA
jgi:hypothetical protein